MSQEPPTGSIRPESTPCSRCSYSSRVSALPSPQLSSQQFLWRRHLLQRLLLRSIVMFLGHGLAVEFALRSILAQFDIYMNNPAQRDDNSKTKRNKVSESDRKSVVKGKSEYVSVNVGGG